MIDEGLPAMQERQNPISSLLPAPRPHWTQEPQLFCYEPQARALRQLMRELSMDFDPRRLHTVDRYGDRMQGIRNGIFLIIEGHGESVPMRLIQLIVSQGFTVWSHNDSHCRARYVADQTRAQRESDDT